MISVNNLRADALNQDEMPNLYKFAQDNQNFTNHYSSSNDTYGAFGLFYGLPSSYASSIKAQGSAPVLLDVLKDQDYSFGLFSGNGFEDDLYSEVIFRGLNLANDLDGTQAHTDKQSIAAWNLWLTEQANQPWFSYIEVTTVDNFESEPMAANEEMPASERFKKAYEQSVKSADKTVAEIIADLEANELLANTIVVITSNHGSEFNETNTNSWGANSNYSRYQLQVPMVIHWPGMLPAEFTHSTSHLDLSVTLLQDMLGVSSNPYDYSSGRNLFDESRRRWILAGDTREIALITGSQTTVIDKFGNYKLYDSNYKRLRETSPKLPVLMQGLTELQRFYSKSN
jgi:membrane-anchored protein YejM (alkaline phosphatase superfamily)